MKRSVALGLACILQPIVAAADTNGDAALRTEGLAIASSFVATLQPELKAALQAGGPVHAISICSEKAPAIAARISGESGW